MKNNIDISKTSVDNDDFMKQKNTCVCNIRQETHRNDPYFQINSNSNAYADDSNFGRNNIDKSYLRYMPHQLYNNNNNNNNINNNNNNNINNNNNNNNDNNNNINNNNSINYNSIHNNLNNYVYDNDKSGDYKMKGRR